MINHNQTEEQLLRSAIRRMISEQVTRRPSSRARRLRGDLIAPLALSEDYITRVLGFDRMTLAESRRDPILAEMILSEHLIFEGFWGDVKNKIVDKLKDNPLTAAADAAKRFGDGINGVVAALTGVVNDGGNAMETVVSGAKSLASKGKSAIIKSVRKLLSRVEEVSKGLSGAASTAVEKVRKTIEKFMNGFGAKVDELMSASGWKGMLGCLTTFLAVKAIRSRLDGVVEAALKVLSGDPKSMLKGALDIKAQVDDAVGEDSEEGDGEGSDEAAALETLWNSVMNLAWGFMKKAASSAGAEAVEQLAGPVAWVKKLAGIFEKVGGGIAWVCEALMDAVSRATFKPLGSPSS